MQFLSDSEKNIYQRYQNKNKKNEFLLSRADLKYCLKKEYLYENKKIRFIEIEVLKSENGNPYVLMNNKIIRPPLFSLSHKNDFVFCAVNSKGRVGVDVEKISGRFLKLKSHFIDFEEEKLIDKISSKVDNFSMNLVKIWAAKEAIVKYNHSNFMEVCRNVVVIDLDREKIIFFHKLLQQKLVCYYFFYQNYYFTLLND